MTLQEGIILKTNNYQENSKIAYILTENGLISCLIRASCSYKSKNFSYSQELTKIDFDITLSKKNSFDILTTGQIKNSYVNLKNDLNILTHSVSLLALSYQFNEYVTNSKNLYDLLSFVLDNANRNDKYLDIYQIIFKLKLLFLLGVGPNFKECVICNSTKTSYFSIEDGGMICNNCKTSSRIDSPTYTGDYLEIIKILYLIKIDKITDEALDSILNYPTYNKMKENIDNFINVYYDKYLSYKLTS